jgi:hypothetical protein
MPAEAAIATDPMSATNRFLFRIVFLRQENVEKRMSRRE